MGSDTLIKHSWVDILPSFVRNRLKGRESLQKIIANSWWLFLDKVIRMGVGVVVGAWVARYLGPDQYGTYSYATAFVTIFSVLATLGLDAIVVRNIVKDPLCRDTTLGTAFIMKLAGGFLTLLTSVIVITILRPQDTLTMWLVGISATGTIFQAFDTIDFWFQSQVKSKFTVYAKNAAFLIVSAIKIFLIFLHAPLMAFALAGLIEIIIGSCGLLLSYKISGNFVTDWKVNIVTAKKMLNDSWPLIISGIVIMIYMRIDQIMLGQLKGDREVGIYSAAVRLSEIWYFIPGVIITSVFPSIIAAKAIDEKLYYRRLQNLFTLMMVLSLSIAIPVSYFSDRIISLIFGATYREAGLILAIQVWTGVFVFLGVARGPWILAEGLMKYTFLTTSFGAVVNILLNLILIPKYASVGASIATVISYAIASIFANILFKETRVIFFMQLRALLLLDVKSLFSKLTY